MNVMVVVIVVIVVLVVVMVIKLPSTNQLVALERRNRCCLKYHRAESTMKGLHLILLVKVVIIVVVIIIIIIIIIIIGIPIPFPSLLEESLFSSRGSSP